MFALEQFLRVGLQDVFLPRFPVGPHRPPDVQQPHPLPVRRLKKL
jgi:hypothetical protein